MRRDVLLKAGYLIALMLVLIPVLDVVARNWPIQVRDERWRFSTFGPAFNAMVTPLLGVFLAMVIAAVLDHRRSLRVFAVITLAAGLGMIAALVMFALDYLQLRATVTPEGTPIFDAAARKAMAVGLLGIAVTLILGVAGWRAAGRMSRGDVNVGLVIPKEEKA